MNDKATRAALLTAKRKDKASENIADYVADLLRQGRASEVTDDLMAQADPQRLHHHYTSGNTGQPMPMDKASRMARAEQMGMTHKGYHSSLKDQDRFDPVGKFMGYTGTSGISTTDNPAAASRYLDRYGDRDYKGVPFDKNVIPTLSNIGKVDKRDTPYYGAGQMGAPLPDDYRPMHERLGFDSAQFSDAISAKGPVKHSDAKNAIRSTETVMSDPTNIRSEFARFDPRLSHLAHLSASTGGAMDFARHVEAVNRAGGQIAPSKYLPDVPRQVHAEGGRIGKAYGGGFGYVPQAALPQLRLAVAQPLPQAQPKGGSWLNTLTDLAVAAKKPEETAGFGATMPPASTPSSTGTGAAAPQGGFYAPFKSDLDRLISEAPGAVTVTSGYRTPERQQELWDQNAAKYPDPEVRDNYVARPGHSSHNYGLAADLSFASPEVQQWVHDNAAKYNLQFRMDHEGWHVEPINVWELRDQLGPPAGYADGGVVRDDGITAYHGSPHDFDQFDISKLGTGEGAQSYGHGLYFAGNERIAKHYKDVLSTRNKVQPDEEAAQKFSPHLSEIQKRKSSLAGSDGMISLDDSSDELDAIGNDEDKAHRMMVADTVSRKPHLQYGRMYKVKLNVGQHELLDWDKPMSEQHPNVQAALARIDPDQWHPTGGDYDPSEQGQMAYQRLVSSGNKQGAIGEHLRAGNPMKRGDKWASEALMAQGIKGIKYRDAGSRNMTDGDPTHNYVMFHHDPVQVTDKYAYGGEVDDPMFGHHNTSAKGVEVASGLGGIPMPSMAISKVAHPLENFGDVTLMAHPSMVTPSRDTNVWSADTYTGRQPRGDEEFSDPKAINRAMQADPNFGHMRDITYWHDATNSVTNADEMMKTAQLGVARGIDPKQHASFHDYVSDVRQKLGYEAYKNDHMPGLRAYGDIKRVLYPKDLFTSSGNRKKPVDYTLENVMKRMKGAAEAGAEGFNYGPGNFRAIHTPKFASMGEIKSDRGLIVPSDQMKPIKSQFEDAYSGLVEKLVQATGRKGFRAYDEAADALTDISKGRKHDWFGDVPPELVSQIRELGRHASKMPTEYFEAKSKRAIPLASFPAALVPKSDPESARRLTEAGVKNVMQYGSPEERVAMYRSQPGLMFKNGGKAMALTRGFTKDGKAAMMALKSKGN